MHKMTDVAVEIIEVVTSNANNDVSDRRILKRSYEVHQVEANSSSSFLEQKMDMLDKQIEPMIKA